MEHSAHKEDAIAHVDERHRSRESNLDSADPELLPEVDQSQERNEFVRTFSQHRERIERIKSRRNVAPILSFFPLKVIFLDILITFGDVATDFAQAYALIQSDGDSAFAGKTNIYGWLSLAIIWIPGIVAAIHIISTQHGVQSFKRVLLSCLICVICYPVIPLVFYFRMLWFRSDDVDQAHSKVSLQTKASFGYLNEGTKRQSNLSDSITGFYYSFKRTLTGRRRSGSGRSTPRSSGKTFQRTNETSKAATTSQRRRFPAIPAEDANEERSKKLKTFEDAERNAMTAHAIAGGVESPLQFILQGWLIMMGKIPLPWEITGSEKELLDLQKNPIYLPSTSLLSFIFSILSMMKATIEFNILGVHITRVLTRERFTRFILLVTDHLPFLASVGFFRLSVHVFLLTYLNVRALFPMGVFWLCNLIITHTVFKSNMPHWMNSVISVFLPVCLPLDIASRHYDRFNLVKRQYRTFFLQTLVSNIIYQPTIAVTMYLVNFDPSWNYDPNTILNNFMFNLAGSTLSVMGIISLVLSIHPKWRELCRCCSRSESGQDPYCSYDMLAEKSRTREIPLEIIRETHASQDSLDLDPEEPRPKTSQKNVTLNSNRNRSKISVMTITPKKASIEKEMHSFLDMPYNTRVKRMTLGMFMTALVVSPIICSSLAIQFFNRNDEYVYFYKETENHVSIIQGVAVRSFTNVKDSCLRYGFEEGDFSCPHPNRITYVFKSDFPTCLEDDKCLRNSSGIIIIEDHDCKNDELCFRPSLSVSGLSGGPPLPMALIQSSNIDHVYDGLRSKKSLGFFPVKFGMVQSYDDLPRGQYKCKSNECVDDIGRDSSFIKDDGKFIGVQDRMRSCRWGLEKCKGFKDLDEREEESWCDTPTFCDKGYKNVGNNLWAKIPADKQAIIAEIQRCADRAPSCDWSKVIDSNRDKIRYCWNSQSCILKEHV